MKHLPILLIVFSLFTISCFELNNNGYPKSVRFPSTGGTEVVNGNCSFAYLLIGEGTDEFPSKGINDSIIVSHDWLTAKTENGSTSLILAAKPFTSNKKRKLKIYGYFGNEYAEINVIQYP